MTGIATIAGTIADVPASPPRIGIIVGSTRPNRKSETVALWALDIASQRHDAVFELVDLANHALPHLDEPIPPSVGDYRNEHTLAWAETIGALDGFILVTPEYNHSTSAVLKNALDYLFAEWNNKAVGFISYGSSGGVRAVEHLRAVAGELMMADVRSQVVLPFATEFDDKQNFQPSKSSVAALNTMLDEVLAWTGALAQLRTGA